MFETCFKKFYFIFKLYLIINFPYFKQKILKFLIYNLDLKIKIANLKEKIKKNLLILFLLKIIIVKIF